MVWGSAESEPIYLCGEHSAEFGSSARVQAATKRQTRRLAESTEAETSVEAEEIAGLKSVFCDPFEAEESISSVGRERTSAAWSSAEQRAAIHGKTIEQTARPLPDGHPHWSTVIVAGLLIATVATGSVFLFNTHRREVGEILIQLGQRFEATAAASSSQPPEGSSTGLAGSAAGVASTEPVRVSAAVKHAAGSPPSSIHLPAYASTVPVAQEQAAGSPAGVGGGANVSASQGDSDGIGNADDSATIVPSLWKAVAKGDPAAELKLARLYLRGNGVGQSCEQARVLLRAASAKGSHEAKKRLAALDRNAGTDCGGDRPRVTSPNSE